MIVDGVEVKTIPGFPDYAITKDGRVWSNPHRDSLSHRRRGKWLKSGNRKGYLAVVLFINSRQHNCAVHRLVLETYVGQCPDGMECRHLNGNRKDNRLENLCWGTHGENFQDSIRLGIINRKGEKAHNVKLTDRIVRLIFNAYHDGAYTMQELACHFGMSKGAIQSIVEKRTWKHIWAT